MGNMKKKYNKPEMTKYNVEIPQIIASSLHIVEDEEATDVDVLIKEDRMSTWGANW